MMGLCLNIDKASMLDAVLSKSRTKAPLFSAN